MNTQGDTMQETTPAAARRGQARRHRALLTGAAVAALGTALVGGLVGGPDLLGQETGHEGSGEVALAPAANGTGAAGGTGTANGTGTGDAASPADGVVAQPASAQEPVSAQPASAEEPVSAQSAPHQAAQPALAPSASAQAALDQAASAEATTPPWQDGQPPLPEGGMSPENPDWPNAWEIPDARPTGVERLDDLGAPKLGMNYPRMVPVSGVMVCNTGADDVEPVAAQNWMYYEGDGTGLDSDMVDIVVTGWEDSTAARDALRDDTMTFCVRDTADGWQQLEWAGHEGDDDFLLYEATSTTPFEHDIAIVRQGDYVIGVTVTDSAGDGTAAAGEIARKTADNLEALDPVHGRD